ncbi:8a40c327-1e55-426b-a5be-61ecbf99b707-CDS [Sclerotinia trifoliorum]|uniref:8a40c327-1e55-426b-a5be-61ecbf99b707-CDS n=1 Tax=Sclerotinia trifoliorum TaxID=28548 RepID=A0A8H2VT11_9HELO|nr:8a40c327-1e55-426b-a5be-61ecbf99b707-CDS [Sclerotinia trifoliorum]
MLRNALKEMNEEEEQIALDTPPDTPISEIYCRKRAWHRRKTLYLDMIGEAFSKHHRQANPTNPANHENENVLGAAGRAHVELVLQLYVKAKRSSKEQSGFRDNLMDYYGVTRTRDGIKECRCVVSHSWGVPKRRTAAHIMPVRLRQLPMKQIFGEEAAEELFSVKNGLMLENQLKHISTITSWQLSRVCPMKVRGS